MITLAHAWKLREMIEKSSASLNDSDALSAMELYAFWESGVEYEQGTRLRYNDKLWRVRQNHTSSEYYPPSIDTASLYEEVAEPGQGDTPDNPIPYDGNMALVKDKYYSQDGVTYQCFRDTGVPVYNRLADLVNLYVVVVV